MRQKDGAYQKQYCGRRVASDDDENNVIVAYPVEIESDRIKTLRKKYTTMLARQCTTHPNYRFSH